MTFEHDFVFLPESKSQFIHDTAVQANPQSYLDLDDSQEPLLQQDNNRSPCLFPIKYQDLYDFYTKQKLCFWFPEEIDIKKDLDDWENKLTEQQRNFIEKILAFFASADAIINDNLILNFQSQIQIPEAKHYYSMQIAIEDIHSETYSFMIDGLIKNQQKRNFLFNAVNTIPSIKNKQDWYVKYTNDKNIPIGIRLIVQGYMEGVAFSSSFCSIFWLKSMGVMSQLCFANELISRDETIHQQFANNLYNNHIKNKIQPSVIYQIYKEATDIEEQFVKEAIETDLMGMKQETMIEYIRYMCNYQLNQLNLQPLYQGVKNPFKFMEKIGADVKANFFEAKVSSYQKHSKMSEQQQDYHEDIDKLDF